MSVAVAAQLPAAVPGTPRVVPDAPGAPRAAGAAVAGAVPLGVLLQRAAAAVRDGVPGAVWVVAAVTAVKPARGGATVELAEPDRPRADAGVLRAYLPAAVFDALRQSTGQGITASDLSGMTVVVRLAVDLHPRWGLSGRVGAFGPGIEASLARLALDASVARLRSEGLLERQRGLPTPHDVTRIAVVHPPAAAGWADIAAELSRWAAAGVIAFRSVPTAFEGPRAADGIAAAVGRAAEPVEGHPPDVVLLVRGGGAAASLVALNDEILARAIAGIAVPVICGVGHASDGKTVADQVSWASVDTPSKAVALVRQLILQPAQRARADHSAVLSAALAGIDRAGPRLAALERLATAAALRRTVAVGQDLDRSWSGVREAAECARGRLARLGDGLDRTAAEVNEAAPARLDRGVAELATLMEAVRARARRVSAGADGGGSLLAAAVARGQALVATAEAGLAARGREPPVVATARVARASASLDAVAERVRSAARSRLGRADDGARALAAAAAVVCAAHRRHDAAVARLIQVVEASAARGLDAAASALDRHAAALDGAEPAQVLRRGFALVTDLSGRPVTSVAAARAAAALTIAFADGSVAVRLHHIIGEQS